MRRLFAVSLLLLAAPAMADQALPPCSELSRLWVSRYVLQLKPDWSTGFLECGLSPDLMSDAQKRDVLLARAAYVLDATQWTDMGVLWPPLVSGGGVSAPPNMLEWVGSRVSAIHIDTRKGAEPGADFARKIINLVPGDFNIENAAFAADGGVGLTGQLIHEARHLGHPQYGHAVCSVPGQPREQNCDATIAEDFDGGGSHAVAAIWMAWLSNRSRWPAAQRKIAEGVAMDVLKTRINDTAAADRFACRYFGYYVWSSAACNRAQP